MLFGSEHEAFMQSKTQGAELNLWVMAVRAAEEEVIRVGDDVWSFRIPISATDLCRHLG